MRTHSESIPCISVRPSYFTIYNQCASGRSRSRAQYENEKNLRNNDHGGRISFKARKRISQGIDWLLYISSEQEFTHFKFKRKYRFKVNFITLTLASKQIHSDQIIKSELLNQLLIESKLKWNVTEYLWRAEPQRNGNIHFHILTNKFIPWSELRNTWNRIQDKLGYLQRSKHYRDGWQPNSTDVHSVRKVKNLSAYLGKYCTKQSNVRKIEGNNWGLSQGLSRMKSGRDLRFNDIEREIRKVRDLMPEVIKEYEYATVFYISSEELKKIGCLSIVGILDEYVEEVRIESG